MPSKFRRLLSGALVCFCFCFCFFFAFLAADLGVPGSLAVGFFLLLLAGARPPVVVDREGEMLLLARREGDLLRLPRFFFFVVDSAPTVDVAVAAPATVLPGARRADTARSFTRELMRVLANRCAPGADNAATFRGVPVAPLLGVVLTCVARAVVGVSGSKRVRPRTVLLLAVVLEVIEDVPVAVRLADALDLVAGAVVVLPRSLPVVCGDLDRPRAPRLDLDDGVVVVVMAVDRTGESRGRMRRTGLLAALLLPPPPPPPPPPPMILQ